MEFDKKSLLKLGKLARISISDDKLNNLSKDLNSILEFVDQLKEIKTCLLYTSPSPRDLSTSRMPSSA